MPYHSFSYEAWPLLQHTTANHISVLGDSLQPFERMWQTFLKADRLCKARMFLLCFNFWWWRLSKFFMRPYEGTFVSVQKSVFNYCLWRGRVNFRDSCCQVDSWPQTSWRFFGFCLGHHKSLLIACMWMKQIEFCRYCNGRRFSTK